MWYYYISLIKCLKISIFLLEVDKKKASSACTNLLSFLTYLIRTMVSYMAGQDRGFGRSFGQEESSNCDSDGKDIRSQKDEGRIAA